MSGDFSTIQPALHDNSTLISSQHGTQQGVTAITAALARDTSQTAISGRTSNPYVAVDGDQAACSLYLFGTLNTVGKEPFLFGATLVFELEKLQEQWRFETIRLAINWTSGYSDAVEHWGKYPQQNGWQFGDKPPVIVSELHSPWKKLPNAKVPEALEIALRDLYARYSFAVDQNDMTLLTSAYSEDIHGGFAPMGELSGHETVIGMLKSFRHLAPLWQHFADVVKIEAEDDPQYARMIVARIIPEYPQDGRGHIVYGAHYQLRVRKESDGQWRICWSDYRPGWFYAHQLPDFDIGHIA